jgi:hypothetical protein
MLFAPNEPDTAMPLFFWIQIADIKSFLLIRKIFSSLFLYSERTIASTETNDTSAESS